jgi:hypothetical protein
MSESEHREMSRSVGALLIAALVPFVLTLMPGILVIAIVFQPIFYLFCLASALGWCALFAYCYGRTNPVERRKLLWLLPLLYFASVLPALYTFGRLGLLDYMKKIALP